MVAVPPHRRASVPARVNVFEVARRESALHDSFARVPALGRPVFLRRGVSAEVPARKQGQFSEQTHFTVPETLLTGIPEIDAKNMMLADIYCGISVIRKELYEDKAFKKHDAVSAGRQLSAQVASIYYMRKSAAALRGEVRDLGGEPYLEPLWFGNSV